MRLIDTAKLKLKLFSNDDEVKYAILSHRWEEDEVSMEGFTASDVHLKKGFAKIKHACAAALKDGWEYMWVDTCCIDKTSSAELSEAINSMYRWYEKAGMCYAYLSDVDSIEDLGDSAWFTRGWTLQELIAPKSIKFYNKHWRSFGSKAGLQGRIFEITGVPKRVLTGTKPSQCSVAQRMSWAAHRETTRPEDIAYCLLGLFDVNMPMLYGEGTKAFVRLQEEIIKILDDQTIFAWTSGTNSYKGVLAPAPSCFKGCATMISTAQLADAEQYAMTNVGLSIKLPLTPWGMNIYLAVLQCRDSHSDKELMPHAHQYTQNTRIGIFIKRTIRDKQYVRVVLSGEELCTIDTLKFSEKLTPCSILLLQRTDMVEDVDYMYGFMFRNVTSALFPYEENQPLQPYTLICRRSSSTPTGTLYELRNSECGIVVSLQSNKLNHNRGLESGKDSTQDCLGLIMFGFDFFFNPVCILCSKKATKRRFQLVGAQDPLELTLLAISDAVESYKLKSISESWSENGECALLGDRTNGLNAYLHELNLYIKISLGQKDNKTKAWIVEVGAIELKSDLRIPESLRESRLVIEWEVLLHRTDDLKALTERVRRHYEQSYRNLIAEQQMEDVFEDQPQASVKERFEARRQAIQNNIQSCQQMINRYEIRQAMLDIDVTILQQDLDDAITELRELIAQAEYLERQQPLVEISKASKDNNIDDEGTLHEHDQVDSMLKKMRYISKVVKDHEEREGKLKLKKYYEELIKKYEEEGNQKQKEYYEEAFRKQEKAERKEEAKKQKEAIKRKSNKTIEEMKTLLTFKRKEKVRNRIAEHVKTMEEKVRMMDDERVEEGTEEEELREGIEVVRALAYEVGGLAETVKALATEDEWLSSDEAMDAGIWTEKDTWLSSEDDAGDEDEEGEVRRGTKRTYSEYA